MFHHEYNYKDMQDMNLHLHIFVLEYSEIFVNTVCDAITMHETGLIYRFMFLLLKCNEDNLQN